MVGTFDSNNRIMISERYLANSCLFQGPAYCSGLGETIWIKVGTTKCFLLAASKNKKRNQRRDYQSNEAIRNWEYVWCVYFR